MTGVKTVVCGVVVIAVAIADAVPAAADQASAPASLRMRPGKRVGQVAPDPVLAPMLDDGGFAPPGLATGEAVPLEAVPAAAPARSTIAVTGSLIDRASATTPSPVTVVTRDELLGAGRTMVGDILQPLPEQGNAINAQVNNGGDGATRINLRGLGIDRTLVLLNGRRYVPVGTGADSTVDLNTIPLAVIDRVEILNDAASAVYGSGAIGGVVNLITRTRFTGTEATLYTGQSERGDGFTYDASFITGHRTEGREGNIIFSAGIQSQDPVFAGDRGFSTFDKDFDYEDRRETLGGSPTTPGGRINATQIDLDGDGRGDTVNLCGEGVTFCTSNGRGGLRPFVAPGDNYNFQPSNYLYTPSSRFNAYTAGTYQLRPNIAGVFEASYMHRDSDQQLAPEPFTSTSIAPISRDSVYNPYGGDVLDYRRRLEELGPRATHQSVDTLRTVVGLQGGAPDDVAALRSWKWELSYNYGRSSATQKSTGNVIRSHVQNALGPSFIDGNGVPTCGTPDQPVFGCVPMNILGPSGSISADAAAYAAFTGVTSGVNEQHTALARAHGRILSLPGGGELAAVLSTDFRKESGEFTPDGLIASGDTTGALSVATGGSFNVLEAAAELQAVFARDPDGLERIELDVAARAFRYDGFGGITSNARALVRPVRGLTLRASYATAFREPTVVELFQADSENFPFLQDPCDHTFGGLDPATEAECARQGVPPDARFGTSQQRVIDRGNPDLDPETAKVLTAGAVLEPSAIPGLALSVNFWDIAVSQAIQQVSLTTVFERCFQRGIRSFCDRIVRSPAFGFAIDFVDNPRTNLGGTATSGIDAAVTYDHDARGAGKLHLRAEVQRLLAYDLDTGSTVVNGLGNYDLGVFPKLKANLAASWRHPSGAGAGARLQLVGGFLECEGNDCNGGAPSRDVAPYAKLDVFGSYGFTGSGGQTLITVGVNNVLDQDPSLIYIGFAGDSDAATYDYVGRLFYARLTQLF